MITFVVDDCDSVFDHATAQGVTVVEPSDALSNAGRDWRISCASENFMGVKSAIRSGLAVSALPRLLKDSTMIELGEDEGFPALPPTERGIISSDNAPKNLVQAMTSAIQSATRSLGHLLRFMGTFGYAVTISVVTCGLSLKRVPV